jgi:serine/threonine-protein kinase
MAPNHTNQELSLRFTTLNEIACGRMGAIYRLRDTVIGREVAAKSPVGNFAAQEGAMRRFMQEIEITGQLKHPGIPPVYDLEVLPDGRCLMVMELMEGQTLADFLRRSPDPRTHRQRLLSTLLVVCNAVAYAHSRGVVHRDLEPANIMIGNWGEVRVLDWGLAIVLSERDPNTVSAQERRLGAMYGSPAYMAPEQAREEGADYRTDIFAIGALLCHTLTGAPTFTGSSDTELAQKAAEADISDALGRLDRCGADAQLISVTKQCLRPHPNDRPTCLKEVGTILARQECALAGKASSNWGLSKLLGRS